MSWGHCWSFKSVPTIGSGRVSLPRAVAFFMPPSIRLWTVSWIKPEKMTFKWSKNPRHVIKCYQHLPATICCLLQWITCAQSNPSSIIWLQGMDGVKCFSIYPSKMQTDPEDVSSVSRSWKLFFFTPKKAPNGWVSKYLEGELCQVNSQWTLDFSSIYVLQAQSNRSSSVTSLFGRACQDDDTFRVFKINHDIPICESVSPNSSYRWHSMDDKEYQAYLNRLEAEKPSWIV